MMHILDLPPQLIQSVFDQLPFGELDTLQRVCQPFRLVAIARLTSGIERALHMLDGRLDFIEAQLQPQRSSLTIGHRMALNQTYTNLKLLRMHLYSFYVLRRHILMPRRRPPPPYGNILDQIIAAVRAMRIDATAKWLRHCFHLQNIIGRFNIYNGVMRSNLVYPFGVHVVDILDVLTGINYDIKCVYDFKANACTVMAYYYTENVKFLSYMPDINFMRDCQDRKLTREERISILKYLLALVNLYNGLHGKKEEYERELHFITRAGQPDAYIKRHPIETHLYREVVRREYLSATKIRESYASRHVEQKPLLACHVHLVCSMEKAPFKIMKSYDLLSRDLYLNNSTIITRGSEEETNEVDYAVEIKLQFVFKHLNKEFFDISIKDSAY